MPEIFRNVVDPTLSFLERTGIVGSETQHAVARELLHLAQSNPLTFRLLERFAYQGKRFEDPRPRLRVSFGGLTFKNPVMIGAGWDKLGRTILAWDRLGASGVEVGTVLAYPQPGNPKPRQSMVGPGIATNQLGFNSEGMEAVAGNLERYRNRMRPVVGISVGKNKEVSIKDAPYAHAAVVERLYKYADYFALNVSSPNTPGLRDLQDKEHLVDNVQAINAVMDKKGLRKPLFVKIAPDLTLKAIDDVIEVVIDNGLTGIIATNATNNVDLKRKYGDPRAEQPSGLSGDIPEFRRMVNESVAHIFRQVGDRIDVIGIGGINSAATALERIKAGARIIQVVTGIRQVGTSLPGRINRGLIEYLEKEGVVGISELVGMEINRYH